MASVKEKATSAGSDTLAAAIRVYNTLSKTKEPLEPVVPGKVGIYLCGPTVYKPSHIGHMVGPVIFDTIKRYLVYSGYDVTLVINVTDVDDKLIDESSKRGMSMPELAKEMTDDYMANLQAMGVDTVDHFPKATEHMGEIIAFTKDLIDKGFAYEAEGDVYFDVGKDAEYGKLSHRDASSMQGEGGEMAGRKKAAGDFALWKSAKPGEPSWDSPWGKGRPGWHIECSAMSRKILGETFDMHGGGLDLVFPHHENEIAQSECCHGKPQANYWLHNGLMQAADETGKVGGRKTTKADASDAETQAATKISKSTGAAAFSELLTRFPAEIIRFCLLSSHYRRPISFSEGRLDELGQSLESFYRFFQRYERITGESFYGIDRVTHRKDGAIDGESHAVLSEVAALRDSFLEAMDDDFNTGGAVGDLFKLVGALNRFVDQSGLDGGSTPNADDLAALRRGTATLAELAGVLGLFREPVAASGGGGDDELVGKLMDLLIDIRAEARKSKDFALADRVRDQLAEVGIRLEDRQGGTDWSVER